MRTGHAPPYACIQQYHARSPANRGSREQTLNQTEATEALSTALAVHIPHDIPRNQRLRYNRYRDIGQEGLMPPYCPWYPSRNLPQSCPLCFAPKNTIDHRLGQCMHISIKRQICACHGYIVQAIADEIRVGMLVNCAMLMDAECHERHENSPATFLPTDLQCSRPDIVLIENARCEFGVMPLHSRRDPRITVQLVEVGYTSDFILHSCRQT